MTFFTSDLHLGHENVITLCQRPFASIEEMDERLIANWNDRVTPRDTVYVVGDMVWKKPMLPGYLERLKGKKILLIGNHDRPWARSEEAARYFAEILPYKEANLNGHAVTLCHYPMVEWHGSRREGSRHLGYLIHGHIHNVYRPEFRYLLRQFNALNAGVDVNGFAPVTFDEMMENNVRHKLSFLEGEDREYLLAHLPQE